MISVVDIERPLITSAVQAGVLPIPLPRTNTGTLLEIFVPDFDFSLAAHLTDFTSVIDSTTVIAKAVLDAGVDIFLILSGNLVESGIEFRLNEVSLQIKASKELARADFVASTLNALVVLGGEVHLQISEIDLELKLHFDLSPLETSQLLQSRQTAYRLMVIERATGIEFLLPEHFSSAEMATIIFAYRAIADRSFDWSFEAYPLHLLANEEGLNRLSEMSQSASITFTIEQERATILGESITFGDVKVVVDDGLIENFDKVKEELLRFDSHEVVALLRSVSGRARFELPEAPRLPDSPWTQDIQALIDLESQLDACLVERYNALAAATLAGLSEEEKIAVTARPELDEEAFLIEEWSREDS